MKTVDLNVCQLYLKSVTAMYPTDAGCDSHHPSKAQSDSHVRYRSALFGFHPIDIVNDILHN